MHHSRAQTRKVRQPIGKPPSKQIRARSQSTPRRLAKKIQKLLSRLAAPTRLAKVVAPACGDAAAQQAGGGSAGAPVVATLALVAVLASCGSGHHSAGRSQTTTSFSGATTALDPTRAAIITAYRAFWADLVAASNPPNPSDPHLSDHATGTELAHVKSSLLAEQAAGEVVKGTIDLAPVVTSLSDAKATISDCYLSHIIGYDAKTGAAKGPGPSQRTLVNVTLTLDGSWKVAELDHVREGCIAAT
jgi:hypothetical protein